MILGWMQAAMCHIRDPHVWIGLLIVAASLALIPIDHWYRDRREAQRQSSIEALEALFALQDLRPSGADRRHRRI